MKVAILDDYQGVAARLADWSQLPKDAEVQFFQDHLSHEDRLVERLKDFQVVMGMRERTPFPRTLLSRLPELRLLVTTGALNASFDVDAATELGIVVCGTGGAGEGPTELTWGLIIGLLRHIPQEDQRTRQGEWGTEIGVGLQGKTLGLLGLGHIGSRMARVGNAFDMCVIAWSQNLTAERANEYGFTLVDKDALFRESDILTINLRLSERTRGLVGARELALMKANAYLVNISRGPIVDESALIDVLQQRAIAGAALDTFDVEPLPRDHPLFELVQYHPRSPQRVRDGRVIQGHVLRSAFARGQPIRVINPEVLTSSQLRGQA